MPASSDISVVIPYYNRERYIDETIQSVLAQTLKPLEILLINDCSRGSSRKFLDRCKKVCTIIDLPVNVGLAGARNAGIQHAKGEFIAFLDDDDLWLPQKLEVQRRYLDEHPDCDVVHSAAWFFFRDRPDELSATFKDGPMTLAQSLTNGHWAVIPTILMRTEAARGVGGFDVKFREVEDRDFIIRCCAAGYQVEGIREPLMRVRREEQDSLTKKHWRIYWADLRMLWKHRSHYLQAYGPRGILNFVLEKGQTPARKTPYLDEVMQYLLKFVTYRTKRGFVDPVLYNKGLKKSIPIAQSPSAGTARAEEKFPTIEAIGDISVIISYYNSPEFIDEAIQSVLAQTLQPLEIIIVNDCSNQTSRRYLDRYADICRIIDLPENVGQAAARNVGIRAARGQFVAFLDDDDIWMHKKLELQRQHFEQHPDCSAVTCSISVFIWNGDEHMSSFFDPGPMTLAQALRDEYWVAPSTLMMRTQAIRDLGGFDVRFRQCEERDFMIRVCADGYRLEGIREPLLRLRRTGIGGLYERYWRVFLANLRVAWKNRALYYRVYGFRGLVSFALMTLHHTTRAIRYVDGAVRLLLRMWGENKWVIRQGYCEPVHPSVTPAVQASAIRGDEIPVSCQTAETYPLGWTTGLATDGANQGGPRQFPVTPATSDISVVISFYNREQYIDHAVQSVLAQTLKPLEIILVNDCSRESSRRYLERYKDVCSIIDLPVNVGLAGARNAGIQAARGRFVALLDDDDIWLPNKLERQRRYIDEHPQCSIVHSAYWAFFTDHPDVMKTLFPRGALTLADALTDEYWVCPSTMLFRAEAVRALGGFDPAFRQCEDRDIVIRYCAAGYRTEGIPEPLIKLRRESHRNLTGNLWRIFRTDLKLCWKHRALYMRVYGLRGILSYILEKLYTASRETRYVDGGVRLLLRFLKVKYRVKSCYQDPVRSDAREPETLKKIRGNALLAS